MCLRFVFLLITRVEAWLRLSRREDAWKTVGDHPVADLSRKRIKRRPILSGLINEYERAA